MERQTRSYILNKNLKKITSMDISYYQKEEIKKLFKELYDNSVSLPKYKITIAAHHRKIEECKELRHKIAGLEACQNLLRKRGINITKLTGGAKK